MWDKGDSGRLGEWGRRECGRGKSGRRAESGKVGVGVGRDILVHNCSYFVIFVTIQAPPKLSLGVTALDPYSWDRDSWPEDMMDTFTLYTTNGNSSSSKVPGRSEEWRESFGKRARLHVGDVVSFTLDKDRSLSIRVNDISADQVFQKLPRGPLRVIIQMWMKRIEIVKNGR